jgi:hypothetical protein
VAGGWAERSHRGRRWNCSRLNIPFCAPEPLRKLIEHLAALCVDVLLVGQDILEADASVSSDQAKGKLLLLEKLDKERARYGAISSRMA